MLWISLQTWNFMKSSAYLKIFWGSIFSYLKQDNRCWNTIALGIGLSSSKFMNILFVTALKIIGRSGYTHTKWKVLSGFKIFVFKNMQISKFSIMIISFALMLSLEIYHIFTVSLIADSLISGCDISEKKSCIIDLPRSKNRFDSNHWFHSEFRYVYWLLRLSL